MSNPWEKKNRWGPGSANWNRWMEPDAAGSPTYAPVRSKDGKAVPPLEDRQGETLRNVYIMVTGQTVGRTRMSSYPADYGQMYEVPTYRLTVRGIDHEGDEALEEFEVQRFGVHYNPKNPATGIAQYPSHPLAESPRVVGLADHQSYVINTYIRFYDGTEGPAWRVPVVIGGVRQSGFLIHRGPDNPESDNFRNLGCIAICGEGQYNRFNGLIQYLSGTTATGHEGKELIAASGILRIEYLSAQRPTLRLWE